MRYRFGEHALDMNAYALMGPEGPISVQPKVFDLVRYLLERRDRVVERGELLDALWADEDVSDTVVTWTISKARRALGQSGEDPRPIQTVHGRGYRFVADVQVDSEPRAVPRAEPQPESAPGGAPFVGRDEVMGQLQAALQGACDGYGGLYALSGEAGIGKTRCARELAAHARQRGLSVWSGRCAEAEGAPAFWPWIDILRQAADDPSVQAALADRIRLVLSDLFPRAAQSDAGRVTRTDTQLFRLLDGVTAVLLQASAKTPRVVIIDDLHRADIASLKLLAFVGHELERARLLVLATVRDAGTGSARADEQSLRRGLSRARHLALQGLAEADVERYLSVTTEGRVPGQVAQTLHKRTAGNPLFVQEAVRWLVAHHPAEQLAELSAEDIALPEALRHVVRSRFAGLGADVLSLLQVASVVGLEFHVRVLELVTGHSPSSVLGALDQARAEKLVETTASAGGFRFSHDLVRDVLYEDVPIARRVETHRAVGGALESLGMGEHNAQRLAWHFYQALPSGTHAELQRHARAAAQAAERVGAYDDAASLRGWVLEALEADVRATGKERAVASLALGAAQRLAGRSGLGAKTLGRAIELATEAGDTATMVEAARLLRPTFVTAQVADELARKTLESALSMIDDSDIELRSEILALLSRTPPYSLDWERSKAMSAQAVELARRHGSTRALFEPLRARLHSLMGPADIDELLATTDEALGLRMSGMGGWLAGEAQVARYYAWMQRGDMPQALGALDGFAQVARKLHLAEAMWHHDHFQAHHHVNTGDFAEAERRFAELRARARRLGLDYGDALYAIDMGALSRVRSGAQLPGLRANPRAMEALASLMPSIRAAVIVPLIEWGERTTAKQLFEQMTQDRCAAAARDAGYLSCLAQLAEAAVWLEATGRARVLYELLAPHASLNTVTTRGHSLGAVAHFLGGLARLLGETEHARAYYEQAAHTNERMGFRPALAKTRLALAELLAAEGSSTQRGAARELAAEAAHSARELGMEPLRKRAEALSAGI